MRGGASILASKRGATAPTTVNISINTPISGSTELRPCKGYIPHEQFETISKAIENNEYRIINIYGLGGIGKSSLLSKYVQSSSAHIYYVDLSNAPKFSEIASRILYDVFKNKEMSSTDNDNILVDAIQQHLSSEQTNVLFIFDNLESIMQTGCECGRIMSEYSGYDKFFKIFLQYNINSTLVLSGREKVELSTNIDECIEYIKLFGLSGDQTKSLLSTYHLSGDFEKLCNYYSGNPLALKMAAVYISEDFGNDIDAFLESTELPDKVDELLKKHFDRLSEIEKTFLLWLAIEREPISKQVLVDKIVQQVVNNSYASRTLSNLEKRCLVETFYDGEKKWYLQGVILEFASDYTKDAFVKEIQETTAHYINLLGLINTSSKEYIIETQKRLLVDRIVIALIHAIGKEALKDKLREISEHSDSSKSYMAGNIINLHAAFETILGGFNFSSKWIINADLRYVSIHHSDFSNATVEGVLLKNTYGTLIDVRYSKDDKYILGAAKEFSVDIWNADDLQFISELSEHHDWVRSVDSNSKYVASGSNDEKVIVYDKTTLKSIYTQSSHTTRVRRVCFSPTNDDIIFSSNDDGKIIGLNVGTKAECTLGSFSDDVIQENRTIWDFVFVNNGKQIVSVSDDSSVTIWDVEAFSDIEIGRILYKHTCSIKSITTDGYDTVFCGCDDGSNLEINIINVSVKTSASTAV